MSWSFKIAKVFGIDIKVHATFFLVLLLGAAQWSRFGGRGMVFGVVLMLLLFLCVTLHELGHSVVAQRLGIQVRQIVLLPIGGVAMLARNPDRPLQELLIAIAGPAVNVLIASVLIAYFVFAGSTVGLDARSLMAAAAGGPSWTALLVWILNANIALVLFNMIPAFPMDGGRVLRSILGFFLSWGRATAISAGVGQLMAVALASLGILGGNMMLAVIAVFIFLAAGWTREDERTRAVLSSRRIGDAYNKYALTLDETDHVSRVVDYLLTSYQPDFAVVRDGELLGVVSREQALISMTRSSVDEPVTNVMLRDVPGVDASTQLDEVRRVMDERQCRVAAVYDRGVFLGLVSGEDLNEAMIVIAYEQRRNRAIAAPAEESHPQGLLRPA